MKKFLEMIEILKREGFAGYTPLGRDNFWGWIEKCNPFVFSPKNEAPVDLDNRLSLVPVQASEGTKHVTSLVRGQSHPHTVAESIKLDAPFPVFSIEVLGQYICIPRPEDKLKVYIDCIVACEISPQKFTYFSLCETRKGFSKSRFVIPSASEGPIVEEFLKRLKNEAIGVEHIRERVKIGTGSDKRVATFRKIVHVRPKKMLELASDPQSRNIDWTHRWAVRGHWREVAGLGKDRDGNYCVEGMTWVSEYEKGPEDAPLVKKTRLVTG